MMGIDILLMTFLLIIIVSETKTIIDRKLKSSCFHDYEYLSTPIQEQDIFICKKCNHMIIRNNSQLIDLPYYYDEDKVWQFTRKSFSTVPDWVRYNPDIEFFSQYAGDNIYIEVKSEGDIIVAQLDDYIVMDENKVFHVVKSV